MGFVARRALPGHHYDAVLRSMFMFAEVFNQFAVVLLIAAGVGAVGLLLRQPLIVSFIAVGILVGPSVLDIVTAEKEMDLLAQMGIAVLLFLVGLRLDVQHIRQMGSVALATGLGQVAFTSIIGFALCLMLGMDRVTSVYVAVALTFSSTIIIVKLLSDKRELDSLHGRIAVGFLIVQDLVVVLVMIGLSALGAGSGEDVASPWAAAGMVILKGVTFLALIALLMRFAINPVVHVLARSSELLLLASVAWAVALAMAGEVIGMSREVGAFLAGVSLASTPYREAISGRLVSLRDFLLLFFFINLGARLDLSSIASASGAAVTLSLFVLLGNPLIVMVIMGVMGYRRRTGFLAGLTVAQISEFSLILAALGLTLGHIDREAVGLVTLVGLITIGLSTYMILYSHAIYDHIGGWLGVFERSAPRREMAEDSAVPDRVDVVIFGLGRFGSNIASRLRERGHRVLGVDFDPQIIRAWRAEGLAVEYGDAEDPECPASLRAGEAKWIVSSMPQIHTNISLMRAFRAHGYAGRIALTAHSHHGASILEREGADLVLLPFSDAAAEAADRLTAVAGGAAPGAPAS